jgi:hypothetical protein
MRYEVQALDNTTPLSGKAVFNISVTIAAPPPSTTSIPNGTYTISPAPIRWTAATPIISGKAPYVTLCGTNSGVSRQWVWNSSLFKDVEFNDSEASGP